MAWGHDSELRALLAAADHEAACALLYRELAGDLARFVELRIARAQVDDVTQELWAAVRVALPRYRLDCPPRVWLRAIARRKIVDIWRGQRDHDTLDSQLSSAGAMAAMLGVRQPSTPTQKLARRERADAMRDALRALAVDERDLLTLRFVDDLKPAEIAIVLGGEVSANTIAQRLVRLCRRLRSQLEEHPALG